VESIPTFGIYSALSHFPTESKNQFRFSLNQACLFIEWVIPFWINAHSVMHAVDISDLRVLFSVSKWFIVYSPQSVKGSVAHFKNEWGVYSSSSMRVWQLNQGGQSESREAGLWDCVCVSRLCVSAVPSGSEPQQR